MVTIHVGMVRGRLACIGVDLRSFDEYHPGDFRPWGGHEEFVSLASAEWRAVPLGSLIDEAIALARADRQRIAQDLRRGRYDQHVDNQERAASASERMAGSPPGERRGRPRKLTEDVLRVVAEAYMNGGRRPVQAVRQALTQYGYEGNDPIDGGVTDDQARKAVQAARKINLIPRASGRGKP